MTVDEVRPLIERAVALLLEGAGVPADGGGIKAARDLLAWVKGRVGALPDEPDPWPAWFRAKTGLDRLYVLESAVFHAPTRVSVQLPPVAVDAVKVTDDPRIGTGYKRLRTPGKRRNLAPIQVTCPAPHCGHVREVRIFPSPAAIAEAKARLCKTCAAAKQKATMAAKCAARRAARATSGNRKGAKG